MAKKEFHKTRKKALVKEIKKLVVYRQKLNCMEKIELERFKTITKDIEFNLKILKNYDI